MPVQDQPYELRYYRELPLEELYSPLLDRLGGAGFPQRNRSLIEGLKDSIQNSGMRNPLTVEWFDPYGEKHRNPRWSVRIGNNRLIALLELGDAHAPCLVIYPHKHAPEGFPVTAPSGSYEVLDFISALALFDASHPWWHSYTLQLYRPDLVPPAA